MLNNFSTLVNIGFLSNAKEQLKVAQYTLEDIYMGDEFDDFCWNFNDEAKRLDFDYYYNELAVKEFICNEILSARHSKGDTLIISIPEGYIYCSYSKKTIKELATDNYNIAGLIPYYITKRKINGRMMWLCLVFPFNPPNYN